MTLSRFSLSAFGLLCGMGFAADTTAQEQKLDTIEPAAEAIDMGLAGEQPANIARYILARGAGTARLSPDGSRVAFRYGITGKDQVWTLPVTGGQPQQQTFGNGVTFFEWAPRGSQLIYGADNNGELRGGRLA